MSGSSEPHSAEIQDNGVVVRPAEPEDYARARAVQWSAGWKEPPHSHRHWPPHDIEWVNRHYFREFIAEVDGVVAGRIGLEAYCPPFAELVNLCVRQDYRRNGLGQLLTRAGQREAARMGYSMLFLQTEIDNLPAHRLYAAQGWVPTAHGNMLRMVKLLDYPLLESFKRDHALYQYRCSPHPDAPRTWLMEWYAFVTDDTLTLTLEGGASRSESGGVGPAITGFDWRVNEGARRLAVNLTREPITDVEPGNHIEIEISATNGGTQAESGVFQMVLPHAMLVTNPQTNVEKTFAWRLDPGELLRQPIVLHIEQHFDARALWYLNYASVPVSVETYWKGQRALLSTCVPMAAPRPE